MQWPFVAFTPLSDYAWGMNKRLKNQVGFSTFEIVLVAAVIVLIGLVGWRLYENRHNSANNPAQTQAAKVYASWKTYTSSAAGYSIKYPSNWNISTSINNGGAEDTLITSPNNFQIAALSFSKNSAYWQQPGGGDASCGNECLSINQSTRINASGYGPLLIDATTAGAAGGTINELLLFPSTNDSLIASPTKPGIFSWFYGSQQGLKEEQQTSMTAAQFLAMSDVKTASLIYKSLTY